MANVITLTSGTSYAAEAFSAGIAIPVKYFIPMYDPRFDPYILSGSIVPASACEPVSAVSFYGEPIYNTSNLSATYTYSMTGTKMLLSAAGQSGSSTITGNPFNVTSYQNLLNGKPLSPLVSGSSMVYSAGSWSIGGYTNVPVSGTLRTVSGYSNTRSIYFPIDSYAPIVSSDGTGVGRGCYRVRLGNTVGQFKFNKLILYMTRYSGGVEDTTAEPVPAFVVSLNRPIIKSTDGSNINYFEAEIEVQLSAANYFGTVSYLSNSQFNAAGPGILNYTGKVAIGSSAIPGSWEPRSRLHLYSEDAVDNLRFSNENFDYLSFDMATLGTNRVSYIMNTSASKSIEMRVRGTVSASSNLFVGNNAIVSGGLSVAGRVTADNAGVFTVSNVAYLNTLEVYTTTTLDGNLTTLGRNSFYQDTTVYNGYTAAPAIRIMSAGDVSASGYLYAGNIIIDRQATIRDIYVTRGLTSLGDMRFTHGQTGNTSIILTSAGDVSAGNNLLGQGLTVNLNGSFGGSLYASVDLQVNRNSQFGRESTFYGNSIYYNPANSIYSLVTSGGVIMARTALITSGTLYVGNQFSVDNTGVLSVGNIAYLNMLEVYNDAYFDSNVHITDRLNLQTPNFTWDTDTRLWLGAAVNVSASMRTNANLYFDGGGIFMRGNTVTATAPGGTPYYEADLGSFYSGTVYFPASFSVARTARVNTSIVTSNSIILLQPIYTGGATGKVDLVITGISSNTYFQLYVVPDDGSQGIDGFYFVVINRA